MRKILIFGGASAIAQETAKLFASDGDKLFLVDIAEDRLANIAEDLKLRGATTVDFLAADLADSKGHPDIIAKADTAMDGLDTVFIAHGTLPKQKDCESDVSKTLQELDVNFISAVSILTLVANRFESEKQGSIAVISSVAGDRGRGSNYVYGSAKGGLSIFLQGLRNRLSKSGVNVTTIKPGFVDTPMTDGFDKGGFLWASPAQIGKGIHKAISKGKSEAYLPKFWWMIMFIIRSIPEFIFKKLGL